MWVGVFFEHSVLLEDRVRLSPSLNVRHLALFSDYLTVLIVEIKQYSWTSSLPLWRGLAYPPLLITRAGSRRHCVTCCGMLSSGTWNRMEKSLETRVWLKVNFSVLRECKKELCDIMSPWTKHSTNRKQPLYNGLWGRCCQQINSQNWELPYI